MKFLKTQLSKMVQSGGFIYRLFDNFKITDTLMSLAAKLIKEKIAPKSEKDFANLLVDTEFNALSKKIKKGISAIMALGIMLTNNEIKDIKVIQSLENRILLKGTTRKISSQEGGFLNFLRPLMTAGLPLMKNRVTP